MSGLNPFRIAQQQLDDAAEKLGLDSSHQKGVGSFGPGRDTEDIKGSKGARSLANGRYENESNLSNYKT
jgi:hypothetical protein